MSVDIESFSEKHLTDFCFFCKSQHNCVVGMKGTNDIFCSFILAIELPIFHIVYYIWSGPMLGTWQDTNNRMLTSS